VVGSCWKAPRNPVCHRTEAFDSIALEHAVVFVVVFAACIASAVTAPSSKLGELSLQQFLPNTAALDPGHCSTQHCHSSGRIHIQAHLGMPSFLRYIEQRLLACVQ
jgi:hypothetical protein